MEIEKKNRIPIKATHREVYTLTEHISKRGDKWFSSEKTIVKI